MTADVLEKGAQRSFRPHQTLDHLPEHLTWKGVLLCPAVFQQRALGTEVSMGPHVLYLLCGAMVAHLTPTGSFSRTPYHPGERKAIEVSTGSEEGGEVCDLYVLMTLA